MKGNAPATIVVSRACTLKGKKRPAINFHRYLVAARLSSLHRTQGLSFPVAWTSLPASFEPEPTGWGAVEKSDRSGGKERVSRVISLWCSQSWAAGFGDFSEPDRFPFMYLYKRYAMTGQREGRLASKRGTHTAKQIQTGPRYLSQPSRLEMHIWLKTGCLLPCRC
jgi:hypothetical protein